MYNRSVRCYEGEKNRSVIFCRHVTMPSASGCCLAVYEFLYCQLYYDRHIQVNANFDFFEYDIFMTVKQLY